MKKALSLFLALIMTFSIVVIGITELPHSHAEEVSTQSLSENNFVYNVVDGNAVIVDYTDKQSIEEIFIPETLGGYPVTKLNIRSFKGCQCIAVTIPATVTTIHVTAFAFDMPNIERFTVDENNTTYSSENGILYRGKTARSIVAYPKNAPAESLSLEAISVNSYAFTEVRNLKNITLSYGYVNDKYTSYDIAKYAFYNATSLESVEMNKSINSIGDYAFASCSSLASVKIYDVVESLGWDIFADTPFINNRDNYDFSGILTLHKNIIATHPSGDKEYYEVPAGMRSIAGGAFRWNSLKVVSINSGMENIVSNPFAKCPNLETFTVHSDSIFAVDDHGVLYNKDNDRIIAYPNGRYESCYNAKSISSLSGILPYAFYLSPIENIYLPDLSYIGYCALGDENGITNIYYENDKSDWNSACYDKAIYDTMVTAEDVANIHFNTYSVAEHYMISDNAVQSVCSCGYVDEHGYAEGNCTEDGFVYDIMCGKAVIKGYKFRESTSALVIPETIDGYPVTKLERGAFRDCMFTSVHIPSKVMEIDPEAFAYAINNQAFAVASDNQYYKAVDGVLFKYGSVIALVAYPQNAPASEYSQPADAVEILPYAFCGSKNLKTLSSWQSVIIRDYAFINSSVETISGWNAQRIGNGAFKNSNLKGFSLISTPGFLGYNAFEGTPFLENADYDEDGVFYHENILVATDTEHDKNYYVIKDGTTVVAGGAVKWKSLEEIYIPDSVETVNGSSFSDSTSLKTFTLESNKHFSINNNGALHDSTGAKLIAYPTGAENICYVVPRCVTEIGAFAFNNVQMLSCVNIPNYIETVGEYAFGMRGFSRIIRFRYERNDFFWGEINHVQPGMDVLDCYELVYKTFGEYNEGSHANKSTKTETIGTGCDQKIRTTYTCSCGYVRYFYPQLPKAHIAAKEYTVTIKPTCTATGECEVRCSVCSKTLRTKTMSSLGHDYELIEHIKATCVKNGEKTYQCTRCNIKKTEEAEPALGHTGSGETVKIDPTCTEDGGLYYTCIRCDEPIYDEWIEKYPATGHTPGEWVRTQEPTCTDHQVDTLFCSVCTMAIENIIGDLGDHNYRSRVTYRSCTRIRTRYECVNCDQYYYNDINAGDDAIMGDNEYGLGHIVEEVVYEPTCEDYGEICNECTVCGRIVGNTTITAEPLGHTWEEEIISEATCTEEGLKELYCTVCGGWDEEIIPKAAHTIDKWEYVYGNTFSGTCSVCGESFEKVEVEITLDRSEITLYNQSTKTLSVTVTENITDNIVFTSSDSNVAAVDANGTVTAMAPGKAVITARIDGTEITAQCEVTVKARTFRIEWVVDGVTYECNYLEEGAEITVPDAPEKAGCVFVGWSPEVPETMPSYNLTFTAVYNVVLQSGDFNVSATYLLGCYDENVTLEVALIEGDREPGGVYMVDGEYYKQIGLYNIKTVNENSEVVQPNEGYKVTIRIAIPEAYKNQTSFMIYHRFTGGGREQLSTSAGTLRIENGYLVFEVTKFSEFEIFVPAAYIKITHLPDKTVYYYNTAKELDLTGLRIRYTNSNGTTKMLNESSPLTVTGFDGTQVGKQTITVKYGQYSDTFDVTVKYNWWQWIIHVLFLGLFKI